MLYYVIDSSRRRRKPRLKYKLQPGNPVWLPEIGLGIGCERGNYAGVTREWLYWYDQIGQRYLTPQEQIQQQAERAKLLGEKLRELGVDPDTICP